MTRVVEITHFRTEQFTLTKNEMIAALRAKYGDQAVFEDGRIFNIDCQTLFLDCPDYGDSNVLFRVDCET
ncbi:hypothetical protein [Pseudomonas sp.]|uniref:hypothetical protein n=1 Tax=Pseudomonas sp. TaxID=306 RepID=UPI003FD7104C